MTSAKCQTDELPSWTGGGKLVGWLTMSLRMFCRETPTTCATSVSPTKSGATKKPLIFTRKIKGLRGLMRGGEAGSHVVDHDLAKAGARHLCRTFHETSEVIGDLLALDGLVHRGDDQVSRFAPAHVAQHHFSGEDLRSEERRVGE